MTLFASLKSSNAIPTPLSSSSAVSIGQITLKAFPSRVSKSQATLNTPLMLFGLCNFTFLILSIPTTLPTRASALTTPNDISPDKFSSSASKIVKALITVVFSIIFPLMTILSLVINSLKATVLLPNVNSDWRGST